MLTGSINSGTAGWIESGVPPRSEMGEFQGVISGLSLGSGCLIWVTAWKYSLFDDGENTVDCMCDVKPSTALERCVRFAVMKQWAS